MRVQERSASSGLIEFRKITGCPPVRNAELLQEKNEVYENCVVLIVIDELKLHQRVKKKQEKNAPFSFEDYKFTCKQHKSQTFQHIIVNVLPVTKYLEG